MLKIRLMRIGTKKKPFYRVVAVDERSKRTGSYIELLGTYNPLTEPKEIKLKQYRIDHWIKQGAQLSDGYLRIIGKAPQRPPRKPKKEKAASAKSSGEPREEEKSHSATDVASRDKEGTEKTEVVDGTEAESQSDKEMEVVTPEPQTQEQPAQEEQEQVEASAAAPEETPAEKEDK